MLHCLTWGLRTEGRHEERSVINVIFCFPSPRWGIPIQLIIIMCAYCTLLFSFNNNLARSGAGNTPFPIQCTSSINKQKILNRPLLWVLPPAYFSVHRTEKKVKMSIDCTDLHNYKRNLGGGVWLAKEVPIDPPLSHGRLLSCFVPSNCTTHQPYVSMYHDHIVEPLKKLDPALQAYPTTDSHL